MKRSLFWMLGLSLLFWGCPKEEPALYTIGVFQLNDAPTLNAVRQGFIQSLEDQGLVHEQNVRFLFENARGGIPEAQRIARDFVGRKVDMLVPLSTPCFQAALHASRDTPIVFSSVANPILAGAGRSAADHLNHVTGISSRGPIRQSLEFIKQVLPRVRRIGTLWTPSELNSEYYLELAQEAARRLDMEIVAVPIANSSEVLLAAQVLINKRIEAIYQISDNTINASFEALGKVAEENAVPLFGGYPPHTRLGAAAAMGWDFFEMGHKTGHIALRVKNGEDPGSIPFQYMEKVILYLNPKAAERQGFKFPPSVLEQADQIIESEDPPRSTSDGK